VRSRKRAKVYLSVVERTWARKDAEEPTRLGPLLAWHPVEYGGRAGMSARSGLLSRKFSQTAIPLRDSRFVAGWTRSTPHVEKVSRSRWVSFLTETRDVARASLPPDLLRHPTTFHPKLSSISYPSTPPLFPL
jgi:hypothetical protein